MNPFETNLESPSEVEMPFETSNNDQNNLPISPEMITSEEINIPEEVKQSEEISTPLSVATFKPLDDQNSIKYQIPPAKFDSLLKVLNILVNDKDKSSNDSIIIKNSIITQSSSGGVITTDIKEIFDGKLVDLHIINPKKYIKLFKNFKNNNDIFVLDDNINSRFEITNGEIKLFLPKQIETLVEQTTIPDMSGYSVLCSIKVDKSTRNIITGLSSDTSYIDYLIQDNLLKGIHVPDTAIYLFTDYIGDAKAAKLDETNADLALRSTMCLNILAEDYEIFIGYKQSDSSYMAVTSCNTGFIKIVVYEPLELATGGNLLI